MPTIATSSPEEPDDEDRERQELRRLLSECMNWTGEDTRRSEAFRRLMDWLREPIEESDRKRRRRLLAEEWTERLKHSARDIARRQPRQTHDIEWTNDDEALPSEVVARVSDALSRLASLHPRIAEIARLRFISGLSLSEIATRIGVAETEVRKHATFARAWLVRELDLHAADPVDPDDSDQAVQQSEDQQRKLERMLAESYAEMRAVTVGLLRSTGETSSPMKQISPTEVLHEVYLRLASDPRLDLEDRKAFFRLFSRIAAQTIVDFRRHSRQRDVRRGAPARAGPLSRGAAPHSEGGMLRRAWRAVVRYCRAVFRRG